MLTHAHMLRAAASGYGERVALAEPDGRTLTYTDLDEMTTKLAASLSADGLALGGCVAWLGLNSIDFFLAYFATAKLGARFAPLNYWLRPPEMRAILEAVTPHAVVSFPGHVDVVREAAGDLDIAVRYTVGGRVDGWERFEDGYEGGQTQSPTVPGIGEDVLHEIVFTSGTTGPPKGVTRTQRSRILDGHRAALAFELSRRDHLLWFLPQFHIGGGSVPLQLLLQGGRVTVIEKFDTAAVARALAVGDVTYVVGVPAHYRLLFEADVDLGQASETVRGCYAGGSVATPELFEEIARHFPAAEMVHGYGSTESGPHTIALRGPEVRGNPGALGIPVAGTEVRVVADDGSECSPGHPGELWVRSEAVMAGYHGQPELTASVLDADGWLRTGDIVRRDEKTGLFYLMDRAKDMIITGGENVYAKEVEDVLATHEAVAEAAVIGVPDPIWEERVIAFVRLAMPTSEEDLREHVRARLAGYKTPKEFHLVEDLPRTAVGKVAKSDLRSSYGSVFDRSPE